MSVMLQMKFFALLGTAMLIKKHNKQVAYKPMLFVKKYNKFRVPLRFEPILKEVKQE